MEWLELSDCFNAAGATWRLYRVYLNAVLIGHTKLYGVVVAEVTDGYRIEKRTWITWTTIAALDLFLQLEMDWWNKLTIGLSLDYYVQIFLLIYAGCLIKISVQFFMYVLSLLP